MIIAQHNIFLLDMNFNKSTIKLLFFSYILHTYKISRKSKTNNYIIN